MADMFDELRKETDKLKKEIDDLNALIGGYNIELTSKCDDILKEIDELMYSSLASAANWEKSKELQPNIIRKVNESLPDRIKGIKESLEQASTGLVIGLKEARYVVLTGIILLILITGIYISLHYCPKIPSYDNKIAADFFYTMGKVKASLLRPEIVPADTAAALDELKAGDDALTSEFYEEVSYLKGFSSTFTINRKTSNEDEKIGNPQKTGNTNDKKSSPDEKKTSIDEIKILQTDQRVVEIKEGIERIEKRARRLAQNDGFFWITGYWRWLEIIFWGEFGVIIGILVWVSTQVEAGKYTKLMYDKEKYWYITEIVAGPIIVAAVFFLLKQFIGTVMQGITEEEVRGSIYLTLGISFTLGLYIRRTLGIFDFIKEKLPLPKS